MALDTQTDTPDAVLLAAYASGDRVAARTLTLRLAPLALRLARRMLSDPAEAEDVAQEAMLRLWRAAPGWRDGEAQVSTWLYRVTANLCTDRLRRRGSVGLDTIPEPEEDRPSALDGLVAADRQSAFQAALATLPERQRQAVVLRHIEGMSNPEIADVMELGIEAVESLTARGKRALAAALMGRRKELGYDDE